MSEKRGFFLLRVSEAFLLENITKKPIQKNKIRKHLGF